MSSRKERRKAKRRNDRLRDEAWEALAGGRIEEACRRIERVVEAWPANARSWNDRGLILERSGDLRRAVESFRHALVLAPGFEEARRNLMRLGAGEPETEPAPAAAEEAVETAAGARTRRYDWSEIEEALTRTGAALLPDLLSSEECLAAIALGDDPGAFEHTVRLGDRGRREAEYRFFRRPLPALVQELRSELYARLAPIASGWNRMLSRDERFPATLDGFLARCAAEGQTRTTPLLFRYERGAANDLHRDVWGRVFFPLQLAVTLGPSSAARGEGGEFVLANPRGGRKRKWKESVLRPAAGDGVVFATRERPVLVGGVHGAQPVFHGVKELRGERRFVLGLPFHDYREP